MEKEIKYKLKISNRARLMRLEIKQSGELVVTVPRETDFYLVEQFIFRKSHWIVNKLKYFKSISGKIFLHTNKKEYLQYKERARLLVENRISYYNKIYHFNINRISIKNTKSRWGSCSKKGNLNFNYKIALLSKDLVDYVIVHELCHLGEFNHSKKFWKLVSLTIPNYKVLRNRFER
ncbi:MAG: hypothetical protein A3C58_02360 [Candidatus Staskawiczbacteria bacterium RIFCSPHIGHO2_02_FULL_34_10]|uniref:YgjP-like metallopeptidase domain-containing protein n=1 Tax=Candidatus Staskawiczbacteria bacterium RIFCSPHIGHO2_02_FULL_34_10 TaxID=1802205 RepID=A0A1G2HX87_9BACT|nr:MAG: hypothetical protein A3C58_02360 [Candidatus Staskawiczbacteria bacterium RIFCSPHIGHO2_02_FULL_34_10]